MSTAADRVHRSLEDLTKDERARLEAAHARLRTAVNAYQEFEGGELRSDQPVPVHDAKAMAGAQGGVQAAETELWHVREEVLGWTRPTWAPSAARVADWFSAEDRVYDNVSVEPTS